MAYEPSKRVSDILNWAMEELKAIPYEASTRWAFYQVQQHHGLKKKDYRNFLKWQARARKNWWNGWSPTTFTDDTRVITGRDGGYSDPGGWYESFLNKQCTIECASRQGVVLMVLYEAEAMSHQFDFYLGPLRVSSAPFKGDASIREKWDIARRLAGHHDLFPDKPVIVLYFGDLDPKGLEIPRNALKDVWRWMNDGVDAAALEQLGDATGRTSAEEEWRTPDMMFRWLRVGLTMEHVRRWNLPDNPERPGTYQWEALGDEAAGSLITSAVEEFWDRDVVEEVEVIEDRATGRFRDAIEDAVSSLQDEDDDGDDDTES